jgi:hypothetical protein
MPALTIPIASITAPRMLNRVRRLNDEPVTGLLPFKFFIQRDRAEKRCYRIGRSMFQDRHTWVSLIAQHLFDFIKIQFSSRILKLIG